MTGLENKARLPRPNGMSSWMLGGCCAAIATLIPISLYQTKIIGSLPDPPGSLFASETITTSKAAHPLGVPDGLLGLASYGTTLALILLSRRHAPAKNLLGIKLTLDAGAAAFNSGRQVISFGKLCSWCTGTAFATMVMVYAGRKTMIESFESAKLQARNN